MDNKLIVITSIVFVIALVCIAIFAESKNVKMERTFYIQNKKTKDMMPYIHNKNSGDDIKTYVDEFEKVEGFKPQYKGWCGTNE